MKPVSINDCLKRIHDYMRKLPTSGAELKEVIKTTLEIAGVKYVD